jgi:peptidoglycan-associated lipoprotein
MKNILSLFFVGFLTLGINNANAVTLQPCSVDEFKVSIGDRVLFNYDSYELTPDAKVILDREIDWLKKCPQQYSFTLEGHADNRGTREYNLGLGERRATTVKKYMVAAGIDSQRIQTISYGKERPVVIGENEVAWSLNRRAVLILNR